MLEGLDVLDRRLLYLINGAHSPAMDAFMLWATARVSWIPFYIALLLFLFYRLGWRAVPLLLVLALLVTVTDQLSTQLLKPWVHRLRPCHNPLLISTLHLLPNTCGGEYGFVSSHAANTTAVTFYLVASLGRSLRWLALPLGCWALLQCYSRIYLGVHYPGDVVGGALLGALLALLATRFYNWLLSYYPFIIKIFHPNSLLF